MIEAGGDGTYDLFFDDPHDTPYEVFHANEPYGKSGEILVCDYAGKLTPFAKLSPLPLAMNQGLMFRRIHVAPAWRDLAAKAAGF